MIGSVKPDEDARKISLAQNGAVDTLSVLSDTPGGRRSASQRFVSPERPSVSGVLAQLVERLNGIEEVRGSNPLGSTTRICEWWLASRDGKPAHRENPSRFADRCRGIRPAASTSSLADHRLSVEIPPQLGYLSAWGKIKWLEIGE